MTYRVQITRKAAKAIAQLQPTMQRRIMAEVRGLAEDPHPAGSIKLTGADAYRVRVGTFRIIYTVDSGVMTVEVIRVAHRSEVYKGK